MSSLCSEHTTPLRVDEVDAWPRCALLRLRRGSTGGWQRQWLVCMPCRKVQNDTTGVVQHTSAVYSGGSSLFEAARLSRHFVASMSGSDNGGGAASAGLQAGHHNGTAEARSPLSSAESARGGALLRAREGRLCQRRKGLHLPPYLKTSHRGGRTRLLQVSATWLVVVGALMAHLKLNNLPSAHSKDAPQENDRSMDMDEDSSQDTHGKRAEAAPNNSPERTSSPKAVQRRMPLGQGATITRDAREALEQTENLALYMRHHQILPAHFFTVVLEIQGPYSVASCIEKAGGSVYDLKKKLSEVLVKLPTTTDVYVVDELEASPVLRQAALRALAVALKDRYASVGLHHFILALLEVPRIRTLLQEVGTDVKTFLESVTTLYERKLKEDLTGTPEKNRRAGAGQQGGDLGQDSVKQFGVDLTTLAEEGRIPPVFGRNKEIREVMTVLTRKGKGNPCLIGDPGVGKTAVAEGLALRIIEGMTPKLLRDKRLFSVDLGALVAGASHRGEFESRFKKLLKYVREGMSVYEVLDSNGRVILFIDEIHMLLGTGKSEGPMDAANLLKPAMARGEVRIVGATTHEEYKIIERDAALERRFKPIMVEEPPTSQAISILQRLRPSFEEHHEMLILDDAITAAVLLSQKYIKHRKLPDKAIDLVDEACAAKRAQLEMGEEWGDPELPKRPVGVSEKPEENAHVRRLQGHEHPEGTEEELRKLEKELEEEAERQNNRVKLTATDVASVVSAWTGIPVGKISEDEKTTILRLAEILQEKVIGQHEASRAVADAIMRSRAGLSEEYAPIGSFLFLGPPGVGKTELARVLATQIFHSEKRLVRIDMAEFAEKNSLSKLIGTSPGYVGYEAGGKLTDAVKKRPYSVVLFDEIEKGEPSILDILLQILDGGRLTDGKGVEVDFTNTIVVLTSNVGAQYIVAAHNKACHGKTSIGHFDPAKESLETFAQAAEAVPRRVTCDKTRKQEKGSARSRVDANWKTEIKKRILDEMAASGLLRREIADRLSGVILFEPISPSNVKKIIMIQMTRLVEQLGARNVELAMDDSAANLIIQNVYSDTSGVRQLKNFIDTHIKSPISRLLFNEWIAPGMRVLITASKKFKNSLEVHACSLLNGACVLHTRKARILSTVPQNGGGPSAAGA